MAREFDGNTANYLSIADGGGPDVTGTLLTVSAWVRPDVGPSTSMAICTKGSGATATQWQLIQDGTTGKYQFIIGDSAGIDTATSTTAPAIGVVHHVVGVKALNGSTGIKLYIDGLLEAQPDSSRTIQNTAHPINIGRRSNANDIPYDGLIEEVAIWRAALTAEQILALFYGASPVQIKPATSTGLVGWWPLWGVASPEPDYVGGYVSSLFFPKPATVNGTLANPGVYFPRPLPYAFAFDVEQLSRPAGPPPNDNFADAVIMSTTLPGSLVQQSTRNATEEVGELDASETAQSIWYTFSPAVSGFYRIDFNTIKWNGISGFGFGSISVAIKHDATLAEFDNTTDKQLYGGGISVSGVSGTATLQGATMYMESGEDYQIRVWSGQGFGGSAAVNNFTCRFTLDWDSVVISPPVNDNWEDATVIPTTMPNTLTGQTTFDATNEEGEYTLPAQTVWYKFTPAVDGVYLFTVPYATLVGMGTSGEYAHVILYDGTGATEVTDLGGIYITQMTVDTDTASDALMYSPMTAGTTYYIVFYSPLDQGSGTFNHRVIEFDLLTEGLPPVDNDDFADREVISGASGSFDFGSLGSSYETAGSEPPSMYYNDPQNKGTVWFDWTCPATGWYKFQVGTLETHPGNGSYDLAIWTGSALNALTTVGRNWAGDEPTDDAPNGAKTGIGFSATNGVSYKIQVANWNELVQNESQLVWATMPAPTGDTTATAAAFPDGRVDNHGHDASEPPPNFSTRLSAHDDWWFDNGQVGKVKWFKFVCPADQTVSVFGKMFDGDPDFGTSMPNGDYGLLFYKGANYASLTAATSTVAQGSVDAAMMMSQGAYAQSVSYQNVFSDVTGDRVLLDIDVAEGETLWACMFGLYDADYAGSAPTDASEFEVDLHLLTAAPENDNLDEISVWPYPHEWWLSKSEWGNYFNFPWAAQRTGTTFGGSAEVDEPAHVVGFPATRSVWYAFSPYDEDTDYHFWIESDGDCIMAIYNGDDYDGSGFEDLILVAADDDSGVGDNPDITFNSGEGSTFYIAVDSREETGFALNFSYVDWPGTPPANDDFDDAVVISSFPTSFSGTTVGARVEPAERENEGMGWGPRDTVWYKYVAPSDMQVNIWGTCDTFNYDADFYMDVWHGTTLDTLVRANEPPNDNKGWFAWYPTNSEGQNRPRALTVDMLSGETYYIRIQTFSGGSEDFTVYLEAGAILLNLTASGIDEEHGELTDEITVPLLVGVTGVEDFHVATAIDAATILVDLQASGIAIASHEHVDAATVFFNLLGFEEHECFFHFEPSWTVGGERKWRCEDTQRRWAVVGTRRWTWLEGEGLPQEC